MPTARILMLILSGVVVKNLPANAGDTRDTGSVPGLGRSPGVGNGTPLHHSCLENIMDRGAAKSQTVYGATKNQTHPSTYMYIVQIDQNKEKC